MSTRATLVFVDGIEDDRARLLVGEDAFTVPRALLPDDAREGSWLRLSVAIAPTPSDPGDLRRRLGKDDPGGPIKL